MVKNLSMGTGRRKTAVARVYLRDGNGTITVNGKKPEDYFAFVLHDTAVDQVSAEHFEVFDVHADDDCDGQVDEGCSANEC